MQSSTKNNSNNGNNPLIISPHLEISDKFEDECGVFGAYTTESSNADLGGMIYYGLYALQHRGQESAGISVVKPDRTIKTHKEMGLVSEVFDDDSLKSLGGKIGIGHVRYSTTGDSSVANAQPQQSGSDLGQMALAHNGNLVNSEILKELLEDAGASFNTTNDTEVILQLVARRANKGMQQAIAGACAAIKGSFALVILLDDCLIGVRDPYGIRPLCIGKHKQTGITFLSSESCAIDAVGAEFVRDVKAGEMVIINNDGIESIIYSGKSNQSPCSFEHIYFARPDSIIDGIDVYKARFEAGKLLYQQNPIDADVVIGVPDSGVPAATGYSEQSGIPFKMGLVKNKYIGRTFIKPSQELREKAVLVKLNPIRSMINGKRVVVVDDSLVRGTTSKKLIELLRNAGAKEVHFRLASPAVKYPCYFGIDTANPNELIAAKLSYAEIGKAIGADSIDYLSKENLQQVLGGNQYCMGCFSGVYPVSTS